MAQLPPLGTPDRVRLAWKVFHEERSILLIQVLLAGLEAASIVVFLVIHWVIVQATRRLMDVEHFTYGLKFLEGIFFVGFTCVYTHQAYDMVVIFIPRLRRQQRTEGSDASPSSSE